MSEPASPSTQIDARTRAWLLQANRDAQRAALVEAWLENDLLRARLKGSITKAEHERRVGVLSETVARYQKRAVSSG